MNEIDAVDLDRLAQAIHDEYLRTERARGMTVADNPSLVEWEALPEDLRGANRAHALGIMDKLAAMGLCAVRAGSPDARPMAPIPDDEIERLSRLEHERWMTDRRAAGWTCAPGPKNLEHKTHPDLVPYDQLNETVKEKDRVLVRAIPGLLARAGLSWARR
ncbi:MAG: RyR domain-containing protein [bacterium]|nr:RyR domain-containing protein [Candidatus Sumerlaeota bacterium]